MLVVLGKMCLYYTEYIAVSFSLLRQNVWQVILWEKVKVYLICSSSGYMLFKYLLPFCRLPFGLVDGFLGCAKAF